MKAAVVRRFEIGPEYDDYEGEIPEGGVTIDVLAAALSPRARSGAAGTHYASSGALPLVAGIDGVGRLADGRRVYFVAADDRLGTMAERTIADPRLLVPLPEGVSAVDIAAGMLPAISSWAALTKRVPFAAGQRVLVLGATGTSGQLAVQIARHLGAGEIIAAGRDAAALAAVCADRAVQLEDVAEAASEVDIVLDYLWGDATARAMPAVCRRRRVESPLHWVQIGSAAGDELALSSVLLRKRDLRILGSGQGATSTRDLFGCTPAIVAAFAAGALTVRARPVPLAEVAAAWRARDVASGERIVFVP